MPRLIDAEHLKKRATDLRGDCWDNYAQSTEDFLEYIDNEPTVDAVPLEDYKSMEQTVNKLTKAIADAAPVCCKNCIHRPQWKNRELYPPGYWGDNEADIDWTCPLIDRDELRNSWYMDDDFYCPKGERS